MKINILFIILVAVFTTNCNEGNRNDERSEMIFSKLSKQEVLILKESESLLVDWYYTYSNGEIYSGESMKLILKKFSSYNNIGKLINEKSNCEKFMYFNEMLIVNSNVTDLLIMNENGVYSKPNWSNGAFLDVALFSYSEANNDSLVMNMVLGKRQTSLYNPALVSEGYSNLSIEELEEPIFKALIFIDIFLVEYYFQCSDKHQVKNE